MNTKQNSLEIGNAEPRFRSWDILYFVIWFGVLSGLAEIAFLQMRPLLGGRTVYLRFHTIWMSPLANVVVLGIVGLVVLPLLLRLSRPMSVRIVFVVFASMFFLNVLVIDSGTLSRIHFAAKVILAIGLAIALGRLIGRRALGLERFVRRTTIGLVLLVLVLTVIVGGQQYFQEREIIAGLPNPPELATNVLIIVLDTVRAESMSLYGYEHLTTPFLESFAEQGVVFQQAFATSSWTLPSHISIFTGRFRFETAANYNTLGPKNTTLAEVLSKHGYITGGFVANTRVCSLESGLARGFIHYEDNVVSLKEFARSSPIIRYALYHRWIRCLLGYYEMLRHTPAPLINKNFLSWDERIPSGRPFFAFLNYMDAHAPYVSPTKFAEKFGPIDQLETLRERDFPEGENLRPADIVQEEVKAMRNAYDGTIAYLDSVLNELFGELRRRGQLDRTLVIVTSDHGEEFGEHDNFSHGRNLYSHSIQVPLILRLPDIVPGDITIQEPVSIRDIPATVIGLLGLPDDGLFPGRPLSRYWDGNDTKEPTTSGSILSELLHAPWEPDWNPVSKGDMKSLIAGDMHYIRNADGTEEIYDLRHDPAELKDLIQTPLGAEAAANARVILKEILH